jgi:hypothetical protein
MGTTPPRKYTPTLHPASELGTGERVYNPTMEKKDYSSSNRRKFLIGAGSVAAGGSALLGTAATTTFNLNDRGVSANVVTDSSGAIALTDTEQGDIINYTSDELEIDFTEGGASGVNVGSTVTIGNTADPAGGDAAFTITNQSTHDVDLTIEFKGDGFVANDSGSFIRFVFENGTSGVVETLTANSTTVPGSTDTVSVSHDNADDVAPGETIFAAILVDADNGSSDTTENLSGVLNITATQS